MFTVEHVLVPWELRDGEIKLAPSNLPEKLFERRFDARIGNQVHYSRRVSKKSGRIYFGPDALKDFKIGDTLVINFNEETMDVWKKSDLLN